MEDSSFFLRPLSFRSTIIIGGDWGYPHEKVEGRYIRDGQKRRVRVQVKHNNKNCKRPRTVFTLSPKAKILKIDRHS